MTHTSANGETPDQDSATLVLITLNSIPTWRDVQTGRTFPQIAGAEDPPGDGDVSTGADADEHADDEENADPEKLKRRIQQQRKGEQRLKDLLKTQGQELEALKARQKKSDDEQLSETEKLRNRTAELERAAADKDRELQDTRTRHAIERAAAKAGATDPEDVFRLLDTDAFEVDDKGQVTNADDLVKALLKTKPYLAGKANANGVPSTPRSNGTASHEDRVKENREKLRASGDYEHL